ncbi:phosphoglycerate dehydrogenase [Pseudooceanicola nitratireducens]|jgi:D-3-phosphoglycerate dehydrogenase|uniref:D-3-phosphoglycerate dehydrogenase n=1 Tax=Pseudooceanicola nitratireducens TaxID=517719 RepID=A0A1I1NRN4_9RHOB|nr:phosphoglycerate dehydrogenase [Pseudooceanicola nitratireducens]MEC7299082.1 phosphoglycerate dehydrogenase [Pseudomonadota bacterium]MBY6156147.1 phosphoglycerate dehydrogenase [Pseudooceanicola nitratireducens]MEC8666608.1 phosphoglycerate dehydrogenase [Pseudomonadota bacterium]SEI66029.1 D-3-phosphoglycerate dehydrogenase [Pseudooceanicola nitratireducens]SFD00289.1 D-3-phosphoglycerate dehydrogenase [Pseudooceanicola nitratireducens]|eukprot:g15887.t1
MAPKVLVSDKLSETAVQIFRDRGIDVDFMPDLGKDKDKLAEIIGNYDGLAIRSATKVTPSLLEKADRLKVVGRAGIGTDNVDKDAASKKGVIVMNTPFGNMITTAEHAIAMMFAVARQLPEASASTHAGKWEKSKFMGVELTGKTLGVIGAGNIGGIVCDRARGLKMKVIAYDPFLSEEKAEKMGVEKVELEELLPRADFITLHVPLTDQTRNILSRENLEKTKKGVRVINCARGGLVDEEALADLLKSGHVAGAGFDVFSEEPAKENPLFNLPNVVCTPHLGASTTEAQENVALQVAEQMSNYLIDGAVENALNMPSMTAEEAKVMGPWVALSSHLGAFIGQMTDEPVKAINILYDGVVAEMNLAALNCSVIAGIMKKSNPDVNLVSAPVVAKERGIQISTTNQDKSGAFEGYIKVTVVTEKRERSVAGTVFSDGKPRFIQIKGINVDAEVGPHMLYTTNEDVPGIIGTLGGILGQAGANIANFTLGRASAGGEAIALLYLDEAPNDAALKALADTGKFRQIKPLVFDVV